MNCIRKNRISVKGSEDMAEQEKEVQEQEIAEEKEKAAKAQEVCEEETKGGEEAEKVVSELAKDEAVAAKAQEIIDRVNAEYGDEIAKTEALLNGALPLFSARLTAAPGRACPAACDANAGAGPARSSETCGRCRRWAGCCRCRTC